MLVWRVLGGWVSKGGWRMEDGDGVLLVLKKKLPGMLELGKAALQKGGGSEIVITDADTVDEGDGLQTHAYSSKGE
jgi:hypothetical protein